MYFAQNRNLKSAPANQFFPRTHFPDSIKKSFENIILDNEIEITMIKLGYIARYDFDNFTEWRIEPVWFIDGKYGKCKNSLSDIIDIKENLEGQNYTAIISAVSGEAIPLVSIGG